MALRAWLQRLGAGARSGRTDEAASALDEFLRDVVAESDHQRLRRLTEARLCDLAGCDAALYLDPTPDGQAYAARPAAGDPAAGGPTFDSRGRLA
jgi:hypothetical protein